MLMAKMNVGPPVAGLAFTVESEHVEGVGPTGTVYWSSDPVNMTADDALAAEGADDGTDNAHAKNEAIEWLKDQLADGPVAKKALEREAKDAGLAWRTIRRAKDALGVRAVKRGFGDEGVWVWGLPDSKGGHLNPVAKNLATLGEVGHLSVFDSATGGNSGSKGGQSLKVANPMMMDTLGESGEPEPPDDDGPPLTELHAYIDSQPDPDDGLGEDWGQA